MRKKSNVRWMYSLTTLLLIISILAGISLGPSSVGISQIIPTILGDGTFKEEFILFSVRFPRVLVLTLAGMSLALSGAILQTLTKNDLADPGIIGINAGAGVAITLFYLFVDANLDSYTYQLPAVGFLGGIITARADRPLHVGQEKRYPADQARADGCRVCLGVIGINDHLGFRR